MNTYSKYWNSVAWLITLLCRSKREQRRGEQWGGGGGGGAKGSSGGGGRGGGAEDLDNLRLGFSMYFSIG